MTASKYVSTVVVALLVLSIVPAAGSALDPAEHTVSGHPELHGSVTNNEFSAGTESTLDLYVQNEGVIRQGGAAQYERRVQTARATKLSISAEDTPLTVHTTQYPAGEIADGVNGPYPVDLTVPEGTEPGTYSLTVHAEYVYTAAVHYDPQQPRYTDYRNDVTFEVPVVVRDRAAFAVVDSSTDVSVGQRGTYDVTLENTGSEVARHATVRVTSRSNAVSFGSAAESGSAPVETWDPGERKTLSYDVHAASTTDVHDYSVDVNVSFDDANGITRHSKRLVSSIRPRPEQRFTISNVHSTLRIGRGDETLTGTVVNDGPSRIHGAELVVGGNVTGVSFDQRSYGLPSLDPGERATFSLNGGTVPESVNVSEVSIPLTVRYATPNDDRYESRIHQVTAHVEPNRKLFELTTVGSIPAGTRGDTPKDSDWTQLTLRVTNRGDRTLHDVRPSIVFDSQYFERPIESNYRTSVIPELKPGETKTVTYAVSASTTSGGTTYPLDVTVAYEEPNGVARQTSSYTVPVPVATRSSIPLLPVGGGAVVLAGFLIGGFIWWRREP